MTQIKERERERQRERERERERERNKRPGVIYSTEILKNYKHHETVNYKVNRHKTIDFSENIKFQGLQDMFDKSLKNQVKCFCNFFESYWAFFLIYSSYSPTAMGVTSFNITSFNNITLN